VSRNKKNPIDFEETLSLMKALTQVNNSESCLRVYTYLTMFGKTTPAVLIRDTNLGSSTIYRSLDALQSVKVIQKEVDDSVPDKRQSHMYYVIKNLIHWNNSLYSQELIEYLDKHDKMGVFHSWERSFSAVPSRLNGLALQLMDSFDDLYEKRLGKPWGESMHISVFRFQEAGQLQKLIRRFREFVREIDTLSGNIARDYKTPLTEPVLISMDLIARDSHDTQIDDIPRIHTDD
jgi:predicted transcriptional regulator